MNTTFEDKKQAKNEQFFIQFKSVLKAEKSDFKSYPISDIPSALPLHNLQYKNGFQAVYLQSGVTNPEKEYLYWLVFDVESKEFHRDIEKNIFTAYDLLSLLDSKDLLTGIQVALTGYGFRFFYPFYVLTQYNPYLIEFENDFSKFGIDNQIHKSKQFFRIAGYRNNKEQCAKKADFLDCHIHYLESPDKIPLTKDAYIELVSGKPDYQHDMAVISKLLQLRRMPEKWIESLETYQQRVKIRDSFWHGFGNAKYGKLSKEQMESVLGENIRIIETDNCLIGKFKKCPVCNKDGSYVTDTGRLKCYHASCTAGERDTEGKIIGLSARDWHPELADLIPENEDVDHVETDIIETKSIQDIRTGIESAIKSESDYLIKAMPGAGKTTTSLKAIAPFCADYSVLYLTPSHKLNSEISEKATELGIKNIVLTGRNEKNCKNYKEIEKVTRKGYSVKFTLCLTCPKFRESEKIDPITGTLEKSEKCAYQKQFDLLREPGLYIAAYQFISFAKIAETFANQGFERLLVIFDENPLNAYVKKTVTKPDSIRSFRHGCADDAVHSFFDKLQKFAETALDSHFQDKGNYQTHGRFYANDAPAGSIWHGQDTLFKQADISDQEITAVENHLSNYEQLEGESLVKWQNRLYVNNVNFNALKWLWSAIRKSGCAYLKIDCRAKNPMKYITWDKQTPVLGGCRIINLDATGNKSDLDALFNRDFQVLDGNVEMRDLKKTWLKLNTGKTKITHLEDDKLTKILKDSTAYLRDTDNRILLITFKGIKDNALSILKRLLPEKTVDCTHFGAGRGLNQWQDFDAVICLGWLNFDRKDALDLAMMLYPEKENQDEFIDRAGKNEVLQAVHRIRPVNGNKNIIIIARNWLYELGKPDIIKDNRKTAELFEDAIERCESWLQRFKCIDKQAFYALGICSKADYERATQYYQAFKKIRIDKDMGKFKNESVLKFGGNMTVYSKLIETLAEKHNLPICEVMFDLKWHKSLGNLESFKQTYEFFGIPFKDKGYKECKNM